MSMKQKGLNRAKTEEVTERQTEHLTIGSSNRDVRQL